jgi:hypothetical protein
MRLYVIPTCQYLDVCDRAVLSDLPEETLVWVETHRNQACSSRDICHVLSEAG